MVSSLKEASFASLKSSKGLDCQGARGGVLADHFGINKTLEILKDHFYWPKIVGDIYNVISRCNICHMAESHLHQGLYPPPLVPSRPWDDINIDFLMALLRTPRGKDVIIVVVNRFSKMNHFIAYHKSDDATYIVDLFFQEIVRLHGIPRTVVPGRDAKFLSHF